MGTPAAPERSTDPDRAVKHGGIDGARGKAEKAHAASKSSVADAGTLLGVCLFIGCLSLAVLHAVLVQNQARLDDLNAENRRRQERVDRLLAEIAYLDSPEGVAEQAVVAGLVPAAEVVTLGPVIAGALLPPMPDSFGLAGLPPIVVKGADGADDGAGAG